MEETSTVKLIRGQNFYSHRENDRAGWAIFRICSKDIAPMKAAFDPEERFLFAVSWLCRVPIDRAYSWRWVRVGMKASARLWGSSVRRPR